MSLLTTIAAKAANFLVNSDKKQEAASLIAEVGGVLDNLITSDEERKAISEKVERLYALNESTFVAGGRSAVMWALGAVLVYQSIIRDVLGMALGYERLPEVTIDLAEFAEQLIMLVSGTI